MRRRAITLHLLPLLMFLATATPMPAAAYELPPCTRSEFRDLFDKITGVQLELVATITTLADLLEYAADNLQARRQPERAASLCADDFAYRRLVTALTGDFIGRLALEFGAVPAADNPYLQHLPSEQERIEDLAARLLSADRTAAPTPAERSLPRCSYDQLTALANLLPEFLDLLDNGGDEPLATIDALVRWREAQVAHLPICSDGIELALLLNAAATEAAAAQALSLVTPREDNAYASALAASKTRLGPWRTRLDERRARYGTSSTDAPLPACSIEELALAHRKLLEYTNLLYRGQALQNASDLQDLSQATFDFRGTNLTRLPACAEVFAAAWEVRQLLGDRISSAALAMAIAPGAADPFADRLKAGGARAAQLIDHMASRVESAGAIPDASVTETAVACSAPESLFLRVYILPEFYAFIEAALAVDASDDAFALTERSLAFRDLLWRELPRCAEAIELGLLMRRVAADFAAMLWLELAGLLPDDIAQVQWIVDDTTRISARAAALDIEGAPMSGTPYFISAERGANIRACGSTDCAVVATALSGQQIDVADASGAWYRLNLPDNQVGYIASFLVSQTPPN